MSEDEAALLARLRAGDEDACREFVDQHRDRIVTVVARIAGRGGDAEDLAQEAFLKAFDAIDRFHGNSALFTWLYRIAVNTAMDHRKRRRRWREVALDEAPARHADPPDDADTPDEAGLRAERIERVRAAVERLPEPFRTTLVLRDLESRTYEEVAGILDVSIGTVESRIFRARRKLRALLEDDEP